MSHTRRKVLAALGGTVAFSGCSAPGGGEPGPKVADASVDASDSPGTWTVSKRGPCTDTTPAVLEIGYRNTTGAVGQLYEGYYIPFSQLWVQSRVDSTPPRLHLVPHYNGSWAMSTRLQNNLWVGDVEGIPMAAGFERLEPGEAVRRRYRVVTGEPVPLQQDEYKMVADYAFEPDNTGESQNGKASLRVTVE